MTPIAMPEMQSVQAAVPRCGNCVHFSSAPAAMEAAFPGLTALSSGYGSVRAQDGLCMRHGYYLAAWDRCGDFEVRDCRQSVEVSA